MKNTRETTVRALLQMEQKGSMSNVVLDRMLRSFGADKRDKAFISALFYGCIERKITLDFWISRYSKYTISKIDKTVLQILRTGLYQIVYLDSVPDSAAVNESVDLCKTLGKKSASGFVNAVLRGFLRDRDAQKSLWPDKKDKAYRSVFYSLPQHLVDLWAAQYPQATEEVFWEAFNKKAPIYARVNLLKTTEEALCSELANEGISAQPHGEIPGCICLENIADIDKLKPFTEGKFHIQDLSSQLCAMALNPSENMQVLDCCSAPGGKAFTLSQIMGDAGEISACDLSQKKVDAILDGAKRLDLRSIRPRVMDMRFFSPELGKFDRILCDVPCSGFGVIRKKPEIRYKTAEEIHELPEIQYKILKKAAEYLAEGGRLLYSTCTLNKKENEEVAQRFLRENPSFVPALLPDEITHFLGVSPASSVTLFPHLQNTDGFFMALFEKKVENGHA